jgi:hypothetical protein
MRASEGKIDKLSMDSWIRANNDVRPFFSHLQKELFLAKLDPGSPCVAGERKMSSSSSSSMKTKWLKAFRSLKPASGPSGNDR